MQTSLKYNCVRINTFYQPNTLEKKMCMYGERERESPPPKKEKIFVYMSTCMYKKYTHVVPSISFQTFLYRHLKLS